MKRKILFLALIPLITSCNSSNQSHSSSMNEMENKFANAIDLGTLSEKYKPISYDVVGAALQKTDYFKFSLDNTIVFNYEEYDALQILAVDSEESYEYYSMHFDLNLYDSNFHEIETITYNEFLNKYCLEDSEVTAPEGLDDSIGIGARVCDFDVNPGVYYFSLTPTQEVCNNTYYINISEFIGD